jgi:hypothetical protein
MVAVTRPQGPRRTRLLREPCGVTQDLTLDPTFSLVLANVSARRRKRPDLAVWCKALRLVQGCGRRIAIGDIIDGDLKALRQVDISSGSSKAMELDDDALSGARPFRPRFLPDGRRFLNWSVSADGQSAVRAGSLDSRQTTHVAASDAPGIYAAGHLLFQRGATLVARSIRSSRRRRCLSARCSSQGRCPEDCTGPRAAQRQPSRSIG